MTYRFHAAAAMALAALATPAQAGMIDFTGTMATSGPGNTPGAAPCFAPLGLVRYGDGVGGIGTADGTSSIGAFEPVQQHCNSPPIPDVIPTTRTLTLGQFAWDFGGGDILRGTYDGLILGDPPVLNILATYTVDGGEGRFRHATGTIAADADVVPGPVFTTSWDFVGTIDTPAPGALALFALGLGAVFAGRARLRAPA